MLLGLVTTLLVCELIATIGLKTRLFSIDLIFFQNADVGVFILIEAKKLHHDSVLCSFMIFLAIARARLKAIEFSSVGSLLNLVNSLFLVLMTRAQSSFHQGTDFFF